MSEKPMYKKPVVAETQAAITINRKAIQSLIDAHLIYTGRISGEQYEWNRAGAIMNIDERDVEELLSKRLGGSLCCGNKDNGNRIFELVGD